MPTPDQAFFVSMVAGWIALLIAFAWPSDLHCDCCRYRGRERKDA